MGIIQQPLVDQEQLGQSVPIQNVAAAAVAGDAQTEDPDQERLGFAELLQGGDAGDVNAGPHTTTPFQLHDVAASTAAPAAAEMASSCQGAAEQDSHEQLTPLAQQDVTGMVVFPEQAMGWVRLPVGSAYALRLDADVLQDDHLTLSGAPVLLAGRRTFRCIRLANGGSLSLYPGCVLQPCRGRGQKPSPGGHA